MRYKPIKIRRNKIEETLDNASVLIYKHMEYLNQQKEAYLCRQKRQACFEKQPEAILLVLHKDQQVSETSVRIQNAY